MVPNVTPQWQARTLSSSAIPAPSFEGEDKKYPEKIHKLVDDISQLTLLEIADLNDLLKVSYLKCFLGMPLSTIITSD